MFLKELFLLLQMELNWLRDLPQRRLYLRSLTWVAKKTPEQCSINVCPRMINSWHICHYLLFFLSTVRIRKSTFGCCLPISHKLDSTNRQAVLGTLPTGTRSIHGPNEFNKSSRGALWHSGFVLHSTPAMSPPLNMSAFRHTELVKLFQGEKRDISH